ncbi:MAG TPA: universal stress protein [Acidimicrobiales bacterium]
MYRNVIVPFDGEVETRAVLTPASDLAWRCGAKLVVVSTNAVDDQALRAALKTQAIAKSSGEIDFWVDLERPLDVALLEAARHRPGSIICVTSRHRQHGRRRRDTPLPAAVLGSPEVPVLLLGPDVDVTAGLPMTDVFLAIDPTPVAFRAARLAAEWARRFRLGVHLVVVLPPGADEHAATEPYRPLLAEVAKLAPEATLGVLHTTSPADAFVAMVDDQLNAVLLLSGPGSDGPLGVGVEAVVSRSTRPVLLAPSAP